MAKWYTKIKQLPEPILDEIISYLNNDRIIENLRNTLQASFEEYREISARLSNENEFNRHLREDNHAYRAEITRLIRLNENLMVENANFRIHMPDVQPPTESNVIRAREFLRWRRATRRRLEYGELEEIEMIDLTDNISSDSDNE